MRNIVDLLYEIEMLSHIPRSGFAFLGSGKQSVAEHSFCVALVAHVLAKLTPEPIDHDKLMMLCLFHDLPESRIGDLNYVQKKYVQANLQKALADIEKGSPLGSEIVNWIKEYEEETTIEAQLAHDADQIELLLMLKKEGEMGNPRCEKWIDNTIKRIKTPAAKKLIESILSTSSDHWWLGNGEDPHWIDGGKSAKNSS